MENSKKISVGIVGYGNLGQNIHKLLKNDKHFELVSIFSKRNLPYIENYSKILEYKQKIDFFFVCGGSQNELETQTKFLLPHFNLIECYDNHNRLQTHIKELDSVAKSHNKIALCSFGWDPGLFSLMRGLFDSLEQEPYSFWGKGLSQGHTQAIKNINGVVDGLQFTLPNEEIISKIKNGEDFSPSKKFHRRLCYVVCKQSEQKKIKSEIENMPDYFLGYDTEIHFVSQKQLDNLKSFSHKGEVFTKNNILNFSLNLPSNPQFTARVMITFAKAYPKLKLNQNFGAFNIFDIPMKFVLKNDQYKYL